ncbi:MAG: glycosyl hydrolase [Flavobacteriaceae bacterium]
MWKKTVILLFFSAAVMAQPNPSSPATLGEAVAQQQSLKQDSRVKNIPFKAIGPAVMSGRVVALAVNPQQPTEFYVAYASGGVWHTQDNGISFDPIMDNAPTQNIGELAMHWPSRTLWLGTGENNASRSSYAGMGLLKTTDNGASWTTHGLEGSHHIGKILVHPDDPNHLVVGVTGPLYSDSEHRGVYRTTDGGANWEKTLFVNDQTGIIDMTTVPGNFNLQYATAWQKDRKAWNFEGSGSGSGIYKSTDAGQSWTLISTADSGFPTGEGVGRIGLAAFDENILYAIHDSQFRRAKEADQPQTGLQKDDFKTMSKAAFLALSNKDLNNYLRQNGFQEKYRAENVKNLVRQDKVAPKELATYLEDANSILFDTPVVGAEVYKSTDGGLHWEKTHKGYLDAVYYSYGYYFGHIHVAPYDADKIYIYGVPLLTSSDGGQTYTSIGKANVHSDHHALWINPDQPGHLINGNDGGVNISYNDGAHWMKNNSTNVGQFYAINIDHQKPYNVYGGLQDNGVWKGAHNAVENERWHASGQNPWTSIMGGDGMQVQIDNRDANTVYTGFQFGNYFRLDLQAEKTKPIQPKHELGEAPYRFNWQTPILLSEHNQDILYFGSNKLHRSLDRGDHWEAISPDLTQGGHKGNVAYGTLTTLSESPMQFGLLYTGSDDGKIYHSDNGGGDWEDISQSLPQDLWVSRVVASAHHKDKVYATLNGYRWDDFTAYVYRSEDRGATWTAIANNLPASPVNVIREDPVNEKLLYLGNDHGVYVSLDGGHQWEAFDAGLITVAVLDLVIQPEAKHLVVGTHGRSIYIADIAPLQECDDRLLAKDMHLFDSPSTRYSPYWGRKRSPWSEARTPETTFTLWAKGQGNYTAQIQTENGLSLYQMNGQLDVGINLLPYDLSVSPQGQTAWLKKNKKTPLKAAENGVTYLPKGVYTLTVRSGETTAKTTVEVK